MGTSCLREKNTGCGKSMLVTVGCPLGMNWILVRLRALKSVTGYFSSGDLVSVDIIYGQYFTFCRNL